MMNSNIEISKQSTKNIEEFLDTIMLKIELPLGEKVDFKEENKANLITSMQELVSDGHKEKEAFKIAIDRFGDFNDLHSETLNFNKKIKTFKKFKNISILAYILLFGSLRSVFIAKQSVNFYIIISLIGGILLVIKNNAITIEKYKNLIRIFDSSIIVLLILFYRYSTFSLLITDLLTLLTIILYISWYFKLLFNRKLI
ncbi:hypothetical protein LL037_25495 (plasmid) [Clostridium estertheticum]|uniref:Uncharacterized protein n=1 Tax=Clostridium estertheticum TaxID=238834 RepID=A0AA47ENF1_9CLOT|nr:hypothetical protein [Clostridium estertheticum]MBU3158091.1 hypothetical protein [Clostridium estertheticum]MBU3201994.1 hypothetical protein [Clostridium estertheticum]WAG63330.1 hypothetical protein LL038_25525 [Clostridium estertheticum]WAG68235.1 hypothetical protein LL037_25495 [Clostridium estertheticum]